MNNENLIDSPLMTDQTIMNQIYIIREQKVMIDKDLAILYGVETRVLKQAIKRNLNRFPEDFMFELNTEEANSLISQAERPDVKLFGGAIPLAFTEQGVAMLSSILNSQIAIQVSIQIIRIFVKMRHLLTDQLSIRLEISDIKQKLDYQHKKQDNQDKNMEVIFQYLDELQEKLIVTKSAKKQIGFKPEW